ncbi:MAG: hypothetical protein L0Y50_02585 [Beijerinckiaceae bacterium]|nr:hypothetical protein [Beijerinckiaceae bacterium]
MIFYYLLPGYLHTAYGQFPWFGAGYRPDLILNAAIVIAVFLICTSASYSIDFPSRGSAPRAIVPQKLLKAALFCAIAALIAGAIYGFGNLHISRGDATEVMIPPDRLIIGAVAHSGSFYAFMCAVTLFRNSKSTITIITVALTCSLFIFSNSPLAIPRTLLGSYIIVMFLSILRVTRIQKLLLVLALVISQGTLFSYISYISRGAEGTEFILSPLERFLTSADFDGLQSTIIVVAMHDEIGGKGGVNLLSAILFFVPRGMWPGKVIGTGGESAIFAGYSFINISSPLPSEFYVDFGMPGLVILSLLFGLFIRFCDDYFMLYKQNLDTIGQIFVGTVAGYIFIILRGSLVGTLGPVALSLCIAGICHRFTTKPLFDVAPRNGKDETCGKDPPSISPRID